MNRIAEYWSPNEQSGFLPTSTPATTKELISSGIGSVQAVGRCSENIGLMSDEDLDQFALSLQREPIANPSDMTPGFCEAILRAYVCVAAHFIHRPYCSSRKELPPSIAKAIWDFSKYVDRPPSLTYASYVLGNFANPISNRTSPNEIKIAQTLTGTSDEEWFISVHLSVEAAGSEVVTAIKHMNIALNNGDVEGLVDAVSSIENSLAYADRILAQSMHGIDPDVFRNTIRPFLFGHDKVVFRGVPGEPTVTYIGETGAQSGMIRAADMALGGRHSERTISFYNHFILCAPKSHRDYFSKTSDIGNKVLLLTKEKSVKEARRSALLAIARFRRTHLKVVNHYLVSNGKKLTETGTGGTDFLVWLGDLVDETELDAST